MTSQSSIEHGGMSTVFYMVEQFDSMEVRDHFPICRNFCVGIFFGIFRWIFLCCYSLEFFCWIYCVTILWYFCVGLLVARAFYMVPLAYDNGRGPRYWDWRFRLRGMPLMSVQADINQCGSEGMGIFNPCRVACDPRTFGCPSRGAEAVLSCASKNKQRAQSEAICSQWEEQGAKRQSDGAAPKDM